MHHIRGLMSTAQALRRTFLTPLRQPQVGFLGTHIYQNGLSSRLPQQSIRLAGSQTPQSKMPIADEAIKAPWVQLVDAAGDLEAPERLSVILNSFDRSKYFLVQVSPGEGDNPPICKILNKLEYKAREKAKEKAAKASKKLLKEMEFNWAIDAHDLQHRLRQLASFVEKGRRVEILLTRKKHKRAPTVEEIKQVMQGVLDTVREAGGTQIKAMEGEPGKQVKITVQKEAS
ncbi:hypothetical protein N7468_007454 [Penicillium chermesinum]|uniref:Translation initiation factor 3 N-terminal domain-containing protein n=1 Tax=Penicillium chermesinum TaxID=63820 RepID=A0A9W9NUB3_9EURO|nr:uncharacterized protein N7468_007454 [Penicillium chermesinum]KAJ5226229.1 hypothetical protein N7468_007454 [Penicillium chermesinum]